MAIARALVGKPQVLFLDEPTGNLDESNARHIFDLLSELNASGVTIVVVTHDAALAAEASRQITVAEGTVVSDTSSLPPQTIEFGRTEIPSATKRRWLRAAIDDVCEAAWSLWDNPGRSLVAILTTAIAVAGLSATVNLSLSASNQVDSLISDAASSNLRVALTDPRMDTFSDDSLLTISAIDGVVAAGRADLYAPADARVGRYAAALPGDPGGVGAVGISGGTFATLDIHIAENVASLFDAPIIGERIAVLGEEAADSLGIIDGVEAVVFVTGVPFDVIAVVNAASLNSDVMISNQAAANLGLQTRQEIIVRTKPGHSSAIADAIPISLDAVSPGRYSVAGAANLAQLRSSVATSFNVLTLVVAAVLLAATIGTIAAMMSSNIRQRHGEIGIRMATGTHRSRIGALFMIEGFVIGLSGAVVGTIAGITIVILASAFQGNAPFFDFLGMLLALAVGVVGGVVAAILPSWRATRIEPAEAIRS
ncbi:FtsX-like permease family protein [Microbacterium mitrae]|nr:FtsX-like permease family protein [Microbacterium mitrae]